MSEPTMDLLFEIGTEELPSTQIDTALAALARHLVEALDEARLQHGDVEPYASPRRLAVVIRDVAAQATDMEALALGPAARVAFDDQGAPTRAAIGFAKGKGIDISELQRVETERGEYVGVMVRDEGRPAAEILPGILSDSFAAIPWKRSMRWGWSDVSFGRPVKWIVALLGDAVLPVSFGGIDAGRETRGHRFLAPASIALANADAYASALRDAYVMPSVEERRAFIRREVAETAAKEGLTALIDDDLVDEVAHLVEWPVPMFGHFDEELLEVPREVLIVSMRTHQRYFPAERSPGELANAFIFISNMVVEDPSVIIAGNLRVLRARLEDARFFWREDRRITLEERRERLGAIRFIEGIGSVLDRSDRLEALAGALVDRYAADDAQLRAHATRAARLSKSDLASAMVFEFGELQGVMGRYYALGDGEAPEVAAAIDEHYMPRSSRDNTPPSAAGTFVALADKLDAIVGCFALGLKPSGSADPYGLRRAAIGVLRIAMEHNLRIDISDLAEQAYDLLPGGAIRPRHEVVEEVQAFILDRIRMLLTDTPTDVAQAVVAAIGDDIPSAKERARVLLLLRANADFEPLAAGFKRVVNIVAKAAESDPAFAQSLETRVPRPDETRFTHDAERALYGALVQAEGEVQRAGSVGDFEAMARTLIQLKAPIDTFFDEVLVNDEDAKVRENRLALLASLRALFLSFADISLVQVGQGASR